MPQFSLKDLNGFFTPSTIGRGWDYQRRGHVRITRALDQGGVIEGEVRGSLTQPYRTVVTVRRQNNGRITLSGDCTCPVGYGCKHAAALLLETLEHMRLPPSAAGAKPRADTLSPDVEKWLLTLERTERDGDGAHPADTRQRAIYLLDTRPDFRGTPSAIMIPVSARLLVSGEFSDKFSAIKPDIVLKASQIPKYLLPADLTLLRRLDSLRRSVVGEGLVLSGEEGDDSLRRALATGRCRWRAIDGVCLTLGEERQGRLRWQLGTDGRRVPVPEAMDGAVALRMDPPWYVDPGAAVCGPLDLGLPAAMVSALLAAPPLGSAEIAQVRTRLSGRVAADALPPEIAPPRRIKTAPTPYLKLLQIPVAMADYWRRSRDSVQTVNLPIARLSFLYDGIEIAVEDSRKIVPLVDGETLTEVERRPEAERDARHLLRDEGFRTVEEIAVYWQVQNAQRGDLCFFDQGPTELDQESWLDFLIDRVPQLTEMGWRISVDPDFPFQLARPDDDGIEASVTEGSGIDWFDLHLGVMVEGQRVDILSPLIKLLRRLSPEELADLLDEPEDEEEFGVNLHIKLDDGRILPLDWQRLRPIVGTLAGLFAHDTGDDAGFSSADAPFFADFADRAESLGIAWRGGEQLRDMGRKLRDANGLPAVALPALFHGTLRPYQEKGLAWMQLLREVGLGGILADDMGLGKTVQLLAHLAVEKASGRADLPSLIVAPTSVLPNWQAEAARFAPDLSLMVLHGADRKEAFDRIGSSDLVLTTYPLLARDIDSLVGVAWHLVAIDEAQAVKNPTTAAAMALRRLDCRHRLALTGTPLENHLGELWALFDFVSPGFLGSAREFTKAWRTPIEKKGDVARQEALARRVHPFMLRRSKALVAADLPPKTEIIEHIEMPQAQRDIYEAIRLAMQKKVREAIAAKGLKRSHIEFLDALLKLRQACCDPRLVKTAGRSAKSASAKLDRLMEMVPEMIGEGRRILLFSQFTSMLALIEERLREAAIPYLLLTGDSEDRATPVKRFQSGEAPLFLISLKAGGSGLNLTAADTVIHYDPWWNPAVEAQATDRAHRIGQDKPVFVYKLVCENSIEVKMADLKARKQALADGLFGGAAAATPDFGEDDIEFLLGS
jgi:superfamily II DNA or RNA helicase